MRSGAREAVMSWRSERLCTERAPRNVASAMMAAKHPAHHSAAWGEKTHVSFQGTSNTKATTPPNSGESSVPTAMPASRAQAPTMPPS